MPRSGLAVPPVRKALIAFALIVAVVLGFHSCGNVGRPVATAKAGLGAAELEQEVLSMSLIGHRIALSGAGGDGKW